MEGSPLMKPTASPGEHRWRSSLVIAAVVLVLSVSCQKNDESRWATEKQVNTGWRWLEGGDGPGALRLFQLAAAKGSLRAKRYLCFLRYEGADHLPPDKQEAWKCCRAAAEAGDDFAYVYLVRLCADSTGACKPDQALAWRVKARSLGESYEFEVHPPQL